MVSFLARIVALVVQNLITDNMPLYFVCRCTLCEYVTADHNSMRRHRMRHTGDKPYQCPHCSYACIQAVSLKLHLKSKHPGSDKSYSCTKCPYRTVNKALFINHTRDHEMGLINEVR